MQNFWTRFLFLWKSVRIFMDFESYMVGKSPLFFKSLREKMCGIKQEIEVYLFMKQDKEKSVFRNQ